MKTYIHPLDSSSRNQIIGEVAIYPIDDYKNPNDPKTPKEVQFCSRQIVDQFIKEHKTMSLEDALFRALARRLTALTGGKTLQNIEMLRMLETLLHHKPLTKEEIIKIGELEYEADELFANAI